jgi:hypothetical protein
MGLLCAVALTGLVRFGKRGPMTSGCPSNTDYEVMKKIHECRCLSPLNLDRLVAVENVALHFGYPYHAAKALAMGALERRHQGGHIDYLNKIRSIKKRTARVGKYASLRIRAFDRLLKDHHAKRITRKRLTKKFYPPCLVTDELRVLNVKLSASRSYYV